MSVFDAVTEEIDQLGCRSVAPGLTEAALSLAEQLDSASNGTAASNVAHELRMMLGELRELAPVQSRGDTLDDLARKREKRRAVS